MSKCYVFAIGGTGSRVLRALTMLLAGNVKIDTEEIVPIIIDPDVSNADLTRAVKLMDCYNSIKECIGEGNCGFFNKKLSKLNTNYSIPVSNTSDMTFENFMDVASMSKENQALVNMLFSKKNLKSSMKVGFKGNPNVGCVVLNQIIKSKQFAEFANTFVEGDKIFIISSIFGGTGASGFPLLLKTLRKSTDFPNYSIINNAEIGAISVLPYFRVRSSKESEIDSSTFVSKAVAALAYYENNIYRDKLINAFYFAGDDVANVYDNNEGGHLQKNQAHLIEFIAATAIVDFCNNHYGPTQNLELGIKDVIDEVNLGKFYKEISEMVDGTLARMLLFANCLRYKYEFISSPHFNANNLLDMKSDFYEGQFLRNLKSFLSSYLEWLMEMRDNVRSLNMFKVESGRTTFDIVPNVSPKSVHSIKSNYNLYYDRLNTAAAKLKRSSNRENNFVKMFYEATNKLVDEKINF